ncbi:hypothetical protein, partial [Gluconobacter cerinus]|uniref:hypothetical protein n=1 Tax=Gluconobacter cerinus TaxID=38307 RepID=UPI001B8BF4BF
KNRQSNRQKLEITNQAHQSRVLRSLQIAKSQKSRATHINQRFFNPSTPNLVKTLVALEVIRSKLTHAELPSTYVRSSEHNARIETPNSISVIY